jgi:hypothetical protein
MSVACPPRLHAFSFTPHEKIRGTRICVLPSGPIRSTLSRLVSGARNGRIGSARVAYTSTLDGWRKPGGEPQKSIVWLPGSVPWALTSWLFVIASASFCGDFFAKVVRCWFMGLLVCSISDGDSHSADGFGTARWRVRK